MGQTITTKAMTAYLLLAAAVSASAAGVDTPWHAPGWSHRVIALVDHVPDTGLDGEEVASAEFFTGAVGPYDGRDVRVFTDGGTPVAYRILYPGPGAKVRLAFALTPGVLRYHIYLGNRKAEPVPEADRLVIKRGVLMETYLHLAGKVSDLASARKVIDGATRKVGADFRPNIFIGHNPFGPQNRICSRFTGYLRIRRAGKYNFVISSRDASFLLVDGEPVLSNGGAHRPQRDYSRNATVELSAGLHEVRMLHVNRTAAPVVVLAWRPANAKRARVVPPIAFAPVVKADCGPLEKRGAAVAVDFKIHNTGEAFAGGRYYQKYAFASRLEEVLVEATGVVWDFGDGQSAQGASVEHVYLTDGVKTVKMTAGTADGGKLVRTHRVYVGRDWDRAVRRKLDSAKAFARMVRTYEYPALDPRDAAAAARLLMAVDAEKDILRLAHIIASGKSAVPGVHRDVFAAVTEMCRRKGDVTEAAHLVAMAVSGADNAVARAELEVLCGRIALDDLDEVDRAMGVFATVLKTYKSKQTFASRVLAHIGLGDVYRRKGDYDRAAEAYTRAVDGRSGGPRADVRRGALAFEVESHLQAEEYELAADTLDRWELASPIDRLGGYTSLLRVRLYAATGRWAKAVAEAEELVAVNPGSNYAPQLLLHAANAHLKQDRPDQAHAALERIVQDYPESALAAEAGQRLKGRFD